MTGVDDPAAVTRCWSTSVHSAGVAGQMLLVPVTVELCPVTVTSKKSPSARLVGRLIAIDVPLFVKAVL